jgi:hypothetical protein
MTHSPSSTILPPAGESKGVYSTPVPPHVPSEWANEDLPHADPIAYLGTAHHPLSTPPTSLDLEHSPHEPSIFSTAHHPRSRMGERLAMTALASLILAPIFIGLSRHRGSNDAGRNESSIAGLDGVGVGVMPPSVAPIDPEAAPHEEPATVAEPPAELQIPPLEITSRPAAVAALRRAASEKRPRQPALTTLTPTATAFDFGAAMTAVTAAGIGPSQCGPDAVGAASVVVTFAPSGRVTRAVVENGPLRGTDVGGCVAMHLRDVRIAPFEGEIATVRTTVFLR